MVNYEANGGYKLTQGFQQYYGEDSGFCEGCIPDIKAFPNPVQDILKLYFIDIGINDFTIDIYNLKGSKVYQKRLLGITSGQKVEFDMERFPKGLYFINIYSDDAKLYSKFKIIKM